MPNIGVIWSSSLRINYTIISCIIHFTPMQCRDLLSDIVIQYKSSINHVTNVPRIECEKISRSDLSSIIANANTESIIERDLCFVLLIIDDQQPGDIYFIREGHLNTIRSWITST